MFFGYSGNSRFPLSRPLFFVLFWAFWCLAFPLHGSANPKPSSNGKEASLVHAQHILVEAIALTERGRRDGSGLQETVNRRLEQFGFHSVASSKNPHDVILRVKCEERKTWTGPNKFRGDRHPRSAASRLWRGPACQISYRYHRVPSNWKREVRVSLEELEKTGKMPKGTKKGDLALEALQHQLQGDDFPLYLAAEWGQTQRLMAHFKQPETGLEQRRLILQLLGPLPSPKVLPLLQTALEDPALADIAIVALGQQGEVAIPVLISLLDAQHSSEQVYLALQALGEIASHTQSPELYDQLVTMLDTDNPRIQTVAVRGLGKLGDQRAITPLEALSLKTWTNPSRDSEIQALRESLEWSLWQLKPSAHTAE